MIDALIKIFVLTIFAVTIGMVVWAATHRDEIEVKCESKGGIIVMKPGGLPVCVDARKIPLD